jgi:hypothetical protein
MRCSSLVLSANVICAVAAHSINAATTLAVEAALLCSAYAV